MDRDGPSYQRTTWRAREHVTEARVLIEKEWPVGDSTDWGTIIFGGKGPEPERDYSMAAIRERFRESQHLGTFRKRGKNNYTCPVCSALVHIDDIHRHADWHAMPS